MTDVQVTVDLTQPAPVEVVVNPSTVTVPVTVAPAYGPPGPRGPQGEPGEPGPPGADGQDGADGEDALAVEIEQSFVIPATTWTVTHNLDTYALDVQTFTSDGDPIEGVVTYPSRDQIQVQFYYPTAGFVRVHR